MAKPTDNKRIRAKAADRVKWLLDQSGETPTEFAARMGADYKTFKASLDRRSFALHHLILLAQSLDLSLDFICGLTDKPSRVVEEERRPDFWQLHARSAGGNHNGK